MEGGGVATELRLGLPGTSCVWDNDKEHSVSCVGNKRPLQAHQTGNDHRNGAKSEADDDESPSAPKAQVVGWPPIRSYRKNTLQQVKKTEPETPGIFVKVSMDGAPYLRKIDLNLYKGYTELLKALGTMFKFTIGSYSEREGYKDSVYAPTYEDKDGDLMLVGDVPWDMFVCSCKRLRIMKGSEARGLGCGV